MDRRRLYRIFQLSSIPTAAKEFVSFKSSLQDSTLVKTQKTKAVEHKTVNVKQMAQAVAAQKGERMALAVAALMPHVLFYR